MTKPNFYITTPIYYVNDSPHLGHAYTTIATDVMARYKRLDGKNVKFLTGTDEHGQKIDKAATCANVSPQELCDIVSQRFRNLVKSEDSTNLLNATNDDFIRTTEERHKKAAQAIWEKLKDNGYIYLDKYAGWYSVRDKKAISLNYLHLKISYLIFIKTTQTLYILTRDLMKLKALSKVD